MWHIYKYLYMNAYMHNVDRRTYCCSVPKSCPTLCDPMDCSTPDCSIYTSKLNHMVLFSGNGVHLSLPVNACFIFLLSQVLQLTEKYPPELHCPNQYIYSRTTYYMWSWLSGQFQPVTLPFGWKWWNTIPLGVCPIVYCRWGDSSGWTRQRQQRLHLLPIRRPGAP